MRRGDRPAGPSRPAGPEAVAAIHALLFASDQPLGVIRLAELASVSPGQVRDALQQLDSFYRGAPAGPDAAARPPGGVRLVELAQGYQLMTCPEQAGVVAALGRSRPQPLSPAALETLAVVAYRQPVTRAEVEQVRGVGSEGVLATLVDRGLVREAGRKPAPGRPALYGTTEGFLRYFGLRSLSELPGPEDQPQDG
jgi:segregation and condensation protein B